MKKRYKQVDPSYLFGVSPRRARVPSLRCRACDAQLYGTRIDAGYCAACERDAPLYANSPRDDGGADATD